MKVSFESDIRGLFRQKDINAMLAFGQFDLSSYADVKTNAEMILKRVENQTMPCDEEGKWPKERVQLFQQWILDGCLP